MLQQIDSHTEREGLAVDNHHRQNEKEHQNRKVNSSKVSKNLDLCFPLL